MNEDISFYTYRKTVIPFCLTDITDARYVVTGYPFDGTQTGLTGARHGPTSLRTAMFELEQYDLETGVDLSQVPISDIGDIDCVPGSCEQTFERITHTVAALPHNACAVGIGGEHSVTYPIVTTLKPDMVISFDAHPDLRNDYMGVTLSHSAVMRRIHEDGIDVAVIGVREGSHDEAEYARDNDIPLVPPDRWDTFELPRGKNIYISIDLDVFDAFVNVGNPLPGGMPFDRVCGMLKTLAKENSVRGIDIVELCSNGVDGSAMLASKLAFKFLAYDMLKNR